MQTGIDITKLARWSALGIRAGHVDPRGAYFSQGDIVATFKEFTDMDEYSSVVEKDALQRGLVCKQNWLTREAYAFRVICSHYRVKCKESQELKDSSNARSHLPELRHVYASFTQFRIAPAVSPPPPPHADTNASRNPFLMLQDRPMQPASAPSSPMELLRGIAAETPIDEIDRASLTAAAIAIGIDFGDDDGDLGLEDEAEECPLEEVNGTYDWKKKEALMLMSNGSQVPAVRYYRGVDGLIMAEFPSGTKIELDIPNGRLLDNGEISTEAKSGKTPIKGAPKAKADGKDKKKAGKPKAKSKAKGKGKSKAKAKSKKGAAAKKAAKPKKGVSADDADKEGDEEEVRDAAAMEEDAEGDGPGANDASDAEISPEIPMTLISGKWTHTRQSMILARLPKAAQPQQSLDALGKSYTLKLQGHSTRIQVVLDKPIFYVKGCEPKQVELLSKSFGKKFKTDKFAGVSIPLRLDPFGAFAHAMSFAGWELDALLEQMARDI
jgi:hypothetical protein